MSNQTESRFAKQAPKNFLFYSKKRKKSKTNNYANLRNYFWQACALEFFLYSSRKCEIETKTCWRSRNSQLCFYFIDKIFLCDSPKYFFSATKLFSTDFWTRHLLLIYRSDSLDCDPFHSLMQNICSVSEMLTKSKHQSSQNSSQVKACDQRWLWWQMLQLVLINSASIIFLRVFI